MLFFLLFYVAFVVFIVLVVFVVVFVVYLRARVGMILVVPVGYVMLSLNSII